MVSISSVNSYSNASGISDKLDKINSQLKDLPEVLDYETLEKFQNDEFEITLEEYTDMNSYRVTMNALYGSSSANKLNSALNGFLGLDDDRKTSAKDFIQGLEDKGVDKMDALKLYNMLKSYSTLSSLGQKNSFVSAKI